MSIRIPIRQLMDCRHAIADQTLVDFLDVAILVPDPGLIATNDLRSRWRCSQPMVSRRIKALRDAGLIDATAEHGRYHVHFVSLAGAAA